MGRFPFIFGKRSIEYITYPFGLANRALSIGSTLSLAAEVNYSPKIIWVADNEVGKLRFGEMFDTTDLPFKYVDGYKAWVIRFAHLSQKKKMNPPQKMLGALISRLLLYDKKIHLEKREPHNQFCEFQDLNLIRYRKIMIYAHMQFRYGCDVDWLKPAPGIVPRIVELKKRFAPNTIGVHVRGTDTTNVVPVEDMIMRMHAEVELDPNVKFFLASDGDKRGKAIIDTFGDRLIINPQKAERRSAEGQKEALVDLFGLASTSRIIGIRYSTFATLAAMLGNKPLLRIKPKPGAKNPGSP